MGLGGDTLDEKVTLLINYLRKMNDDLNIPHCIKHYGADSYPAEQGFVPENVFLERLPEIAANAILMHVQDQIQDSRVRKRWRNS